MLSGVLHCLHQGPLGADMSASTDSDDKSDLDHEVKSEAMFALAAAAMIRKFSAHKAGKVYCHRCGGIGHVRAQCPSSANTDAADKRQIVATTVMGLDDDDSDFDVAV
ncbi:hypothetical protein B0H14DRAFT_3485938 [Mycena olivaceomarginata]|nr:hypothetical protein B0H14DRAFT_3485938 [Mycena olivaceomarginata]